MSTVTAAAPDRRIAPTATASTATTASSAAVPASTRTSVSALTGRMKLPLLRSSAVPNTTAPAPPASPAANVTAPTTTALAASTWARAGLAANVTRISPRRYSAEMNIAATTITAISAANTPVRVFSMGVPAAPSDRGHIGRDVPGPGHGDRAAGLMEPGARCAAADGGAGPARAG